MRHQDINLLVVFDAIMTEGAITRAADRLAMTQPAVSNALSRMRSAWKDELFVKDGRGIQPTIFAQNLWSQVKEPLSQLEQAITPGDFDPATSKRTFRIAASDISVEVIWGKLRQEIEKHAPGINIYTMPASLINQTDVLNDAEVDLIIGKQQLDSTTLRSEFMLTPKYVCVMRFNHPLAQKATLSLEDFVNADHLLVSISGDTTGVADQALMNMGLNRRIAMTVNHFSGVPALLQQSNLICVIPSAAVEKEICGGELAVYKTPVEIEPTNLSLIWHKRQDTDQGLNWLRRHIGTYYRQATQQHYDNLEKYCRNGCAQQLREQQEKFSQQHQLCS